MEIRQPTILTADFFPLGERRSARLRCCLLALLLVSLSIHPVGRLVCYLALHILDRSAPPEASAIFFVLSCPPRLSCNCLALYFLHTLDRWQLVCRARNRVEVVGVFANSRLSQSCGAAESYLRTTQQRTKRLARLETTATLLVLLYTSDKRQLRHSLSSVVC
jgi:hypothetical protein